MIKAYNTINSQEEIKKVKQIIYKNPKINEIAYAKETDSWLFDADLEKKRNKFGCYGYFSATCSFSEEDSVETKISQFITQYSEALAAELELESTNDENLSPLQLFKSIDGQGEELFSYIIGGKCSTHSLSDNSIFYISAYLLEKSPEFLADISVFINKEQKETLASNWSAIILGSISNMELMNIFSYEFNIFGNDLSELIIDKMLSKYTIFNLNDISLIERFAFNMGIKNKRIINKINYLNKKEMENLHLVDDSDSDYDYDYYDWEFFKKALN